MYLRAPIASVLFFVVASVSHAQTARPPASVEGVIGHAAFLDEDPVDHFVFGGALRYPLSPRVSVGPDIVYMIGPGFDRDLFVTGNLWFDFVAPLRGGPRRAAPYLVVGGGLMRHQNQFMDAFTVYEGALTGGIGVRIALNDRWYIAPEGRLGWEPHARLSASVGYRFGR